MHPLWTMRVSCESCECSLLQLPPTPRAAGAGGLGLGGAKEKLSEKRDEEKGQCHNTKLFHISTICAEHQRGDYKDAWSEIQRILKISGKGDNEVGKDVASALRVMRLMKDYTPGDLKKSFVKLARLLHPDKCPLSEATKAFQIVGRR